MVCYLFVTVTPESDDPAGCGRPRQDCKTVETHSSWQVPRGSDGCAWQFLEREWTYVVSNLLQFVTLQSYILLPFVTFLTAYLTASPVATTHDCTFIHTFMYE